MPKAKLGADTLLYPMPVTLVGANVNGKPNFLAFIGEIIQAYADPECLTNGMPDIKKMNPMAFSLHDKNYWVLGENIGKAWSIGRNFKKNA